MRLDFELGISPKLSSQGRATGTSPRAAASPLAIPKIGREVPKKLYLIEEAQITKPWALIALALAERSAFGTDMLTQVSKRKLGVYELAVSGLQQFVAQHAGNIDTMGIGIDFATSIGSLHGYDVYGMDYLEARDHLREGADHFWLSIGQSLDANRNFRHRVLKPVYDRLESDTGRELFRRAYRQLHWFQYRMVELTTPSHCKIIAEYNYWDSNPGELGMYEEAKEIDGIAYAKEKLESLEYKYADLCKSFGPIMFQPRRRARLTQRQIATFGAQSDNATERKLADVVVAMDNYIRSAKDAPWTVPSLQEMDCHTVGTASVIRWHAGDDTTKIADDHNYNFMNSGADTTDAFGYAGYNLDNINDAHAFLDQLAAIATELKLLNQLISTLTDEDPVHTSPA